VNQRQIMNLAGLGLAVYGLSMLSKSSKSRSLEGYGSADDASLWNYFPGTDQSQAIAVVPGARGYLAGAARTPLGEVIAHRGVYCQHAHPGLSHQQWIQICLRRYQMAQAGAAPGEYGSLDGYGDFGDFCTRMKRRYERARKYYKSRKAKVDEKGDGWLGGRKRRADRSKRRMEKNFQKAKDRGCEWAGARKREKEAKRAAAEEARLEAQQQAEFEASQANISDIAAQVAAESGKGLVSPAVIIGGVGLVAVALLVTRKKK